MSSAMPDLISRRDWRKGTVYRVGNLDRVGVARLACAAGQSKLLYCIAALGTLMVIISGNGAEIS